MPVETIGELEQLVRTILKSGEYEDESEVLGEALRLLQRRDDLRVEISTGLAELDRGERIEAETLFEELRARAVGNARENR